MRLIVLDNACTALVEQNAVGVLTFAARLIVSALAAVEVLDNIMLAAASAGQPHHHTLTAEEATSGAITTIMRACKAAVVKSLTTAGKNENIRYIRHDSGYFSASRM